MTIGDSTTPAAAMTTTPPWLTVVSVDQTQQIDVTVTAQFNDIVELVQ